MYRTITDLVYSRSPECPFVVDEVSMAEFRGSLHRYENENTFLSPDAQVGVRKSIAAALGERRGLREGEIHVALYPYSVDAESLVDGLCGPRLPVESYPIEEVDNGSGTMSMELGTEYDTPSISPGVSSPPEVVGTEACANRKGVGFGVGRVDDLGRYL
jgi:hypothetical protein